MQSFLLIRYLLTIHASYASMTFRTLTDLEGRSHEDKTMLILHHAYAFIPLLTGLAVTSPLQATKCWLLYA